MINRKPYRMGQEPSKWATGEHTGTEGASFRDFKKKYDPDGEINFFVVDPNILCAREMAARLGLAIIGQPISF